MKRQIIILSIMSLVWGTINAQYDHELSVYGGGGLSALKYKTTIGDRKLGLGGHFGVGYHYFFSPRWGLGTGFELAFYNSKFNLNNLKLLYDVTDMEGNNFEFRSTINNYKENQHAMLLQIPLMLQFQTDKPDRNYQFFAAVGGKAGIPIKGIYKTTASLYNEGFYEHEQSLYDTQTFMGFGNFNSKKFNGDLDLKLAILASLEAGVKWRLKEHWFLYTGAYLDYGLNNILMKQDIAAMPSIVQYNVTNPKAFVVNSALQSQYTQNTAQKFTDKVSPIAAGIKVRLAFGKNCRKECPKDTTPPSDYVQPVPEEEPEVVEEVPEVVEETPEPIEETPEPVEVTPEPVKEEKPIVPDKDDGLNAAKILIERPIDNYTVNQSDVAAYQQQRLDEKIALLKQYKNLRFYLEGHTCDLGTKEVNERVGLARAAKVKAYMISNGIDESRILGISSKRDTQPVVPNTSEDNRRKNRRVTVILE